MVIGEKVDEGLKDGNDALIGSHVTYIIHSHTYCKHTSENLQHCSIVMQRMLHVLPKHCLDVFYWMLFSGLQI